MILDASECLYCYSLWVKKYSKGNSQQFALHQQIAKPRNQQFAWSLPLTLSNQYLNMIFDAPECLRVGDQCKDKEFCNHPSSAPLLTSQLLEVIHSRVIKRNYEWNFKLS